MQSEAAEGEMIHHKQEENKPQQGNTFKLGEMVQDLFLKEKPVNRISENHRQNLYGCCHLL